MGQKKEVNKNNNGLSHLMGLEPQIFVSLDPYVEFSGKPYPNIWETLFLTFGIFT